MSGPVYLSLGSNLGHRQENLARAIQLLGQDGIQITACSSLYETEPVAVTGQPDFLNLVSCAHTTMDALSLLKACQRIEHVINGVWDKHWQPRAIDIDILFYGQEVLDLPGLQIPHPAWHQRNFVLIPLEEIAPDWLDPVTHCRVAEMRQNCPDLSRVLPVSSSGFRGEG